MTADLRELNTSFTTSNAVATVKSLLSTGIPSRLPDGGVQPGPTECSVHKCFDDASFDEALRHLHDDPHAYIFARWKSDRDWGAPPWYGFMAVSNGCLVQMTNKQYPVTMAMVLDLFRQTPFELGVVGPMDQGWPIHLDDMSRGELDYYFNGHGSHGLACAFKGAGHDRLVHRRWLEHGPWRLIRDDELDLSVVQFHELSARPPLCVDQAWEGHKLLSGAAEGGLRFSPVVIVGISAEGKVITTVPDYDFFKPTFYDKSSRTSIVMVHGHRTVPPKEMLEAAEARFRQPYPDIHIDQVRFLFVEEANARRHMHALWLRDLQCHAFTDKGEVDMLEGYHADPPPPPDWVKREQDRDGLG